MKRKELLVNLIFHIVLIFLCLVCIMPFMTMVATSFSNIKGILPDKPLLFPELPLNFKNYIAVWVDNHFFRYILNSGFLSVGGMFLNVVISVVVSYGFSRFEFPGKEAIFNLFLATMMIPAQLAIISQYTIMNSFKLVDRYSAVLLLWTSMCIAGNTFFYRGFFESIPKELEESMMLDGASRFRIMISLVVPISKPAISTSAIFAFTGYWNDLFTVLTFVKSETKRTLPVALQMFKGKHATDYGLLFAGSVIAVIPIIAVFVVFQKQFMQQGLTDGAVKG